MIELNKSEKKKRNERHFYWFQETSNCCANRIRNLAAFVLVFRCFDITDDNRDKHASPRVSAPYMQKNKWNGQIYDQHMHM